MQLKRKSLLYFCSAVIILNIIGCGSDSKTSDKTSTNNVKVEQETKVPREHRNALRSAEVYLKTMPFSKKGLYNQLTSDAGEKYPADAAQYAVDNVKTNWKENALKAAKTMIKLCLCLSKVYTNSLLQLRGTDILQKKHSMQLII